MSSGLEGLIEQFQAKLDELKALHDERKSEEAAAEVEAPVEDAALPEESDAPPPADA